MHYKELDIKNPKILYGKIIHGKGHGHKHGMPTANLQTNNQDLPKNGVYASIMVIDGHNYIGVTNIGLRPSDDSNTTITIETLLANFDKNIYDKNVELKICKFLRSTIKFNGGLDEVRLQIKKDLNNAISYFDKNLSC